MGNKRRRNSTDNSSSESSASSSSSDEDKIQTNKRQLDSESSSEDDDEDWNERNSSVKKKPTKIRKPQKKVSKPTVKESDNESQEEEDEKEEGEVEDDDEFNDGYDENLMGDEEDQKRLLNMTEKEREQELFNRSEKREVLKTRFEIEKKLRLAKKKEQNKIIPFSDAQLRSTDRRKALENNRKQKDGLKQLKEQREKRKQKAKLRASDVYSSSDDSDTEHNQRRKSSSSSSSSSSSDESSSDERRKSDDDSKAEIEEIPFDLNYKVLNSIRLSRYKMSQWCHTPFFKETVIGCFVRLSIGVNKDNKTPVYRVAEIVDVNDGPNAYDLEKTKTDKLLKLKHGRDEKSFRIQYVSNTEFTEREFNDWRMKMEKERLNLPTKKQIDDKSKHIHAAVNYNFKESDIEAIVKEKEKYIDIPHNFAMKKTHLKKEKDMAEQSGDLNKVEELSAQLEEIEEKAKELDYKRTQNISAISYINERNRMRNIVEAEKAIVLAREQDKLNKGDEPFKRRKCAPILVSMKNKLNINNVNSDKTNESKDEVDSKFVIPNGTPINSKSNILKDSETSKSIEHEQNDLFSAHDFDIQIDFDITSNLTSSSQNSISNSLYASNLSCSNIASNKSTNRRSLNLEEYKKKKGLI